MEPLFKYLEHGLAHPYLTLTIDILVTSFQQLTTLSVEVLCLLAARNLLSSGSKAVMVSHFYDSLHPPISGALPLLLLQVQLYPNNK